MLVHDPAVIDDPGLSQALATAARLAASNARLQAEVRGQLAELHASRRRLFTPGTTSAVGSSCGCARRSSGVWPSSRTHWSTHTRARRGPNG